MDEIDLVDIESIKKILSDKNAWYHVKVPDLCNNDDLMRMEEIMDNCNIDGTFLVTRSNVSVTDITEYVNKYMEQQNE